MAATGVPRRRLPGAGARRSSRTLVAHGDGPQRSAFLSSFFALVGLHGAARHRRACSGSRTMMAQVQAKGFRADILRRLLCFNLFWHALDIVWVGIFTVVYLLGATA